MMVSSLPIGLYIDLAFIIENVGTVLLMLLMVTLFKTVRSLTLTQFWLITVQPVHGLVTSGNSTLRQMLAATYGNEVAMLSSGAHLLRTAFVGLRRRQSWNEPARSPRRYSLDA